MWVWSGGPTWQSLGSTHTPDPKGETEEQHQADEEDE
jgi:hypothetical protein